MMWVLITGVSVDDPIELKEFKSLTEMLKYGLSKCPRVLVENCRDESVKDYDMYKTDIEKAGLQFVEYDYHLTV